MPNRIIKESICRSDSIDSLSWFEEVLFYRLIVVCDDYGRYDGRAAIIKGSCFPLKDIRVGQIEKALDKLSTAGMVQRYEVQGRPFLQLTAWEQHQQIRAKKSKYPSPDETCKQMISGDGKCPRNPIQSESNPNRNRNTVARAVGHVEHFEEFWSVYPNKQRRAMAEKEYCDIFLGGVFSEGDLVSSARNYAEYCRITGTDKVYYACNFLSKAVFEDYLPENYKKPASNRAKNGFNNFPQREYDYEQLEKSLLNS